MSGDDEKKEAVATDYKDKGNSMYKVGNLLQIVCFIMNIDSFRHCHLPHVRYSFKSDSELLE